MREAVSDTEMDLLEQRGQRTERERFRLLIALAGVSILYALSRQAQLDFAQLWGGDGWLNAVSLLGGIVRPDLNTTFVWRVATLMLESFAIGFLGLGLALTLGIPLALLGARLPNLERAPSPHSLQTLASSLTRPIARFILTFMRSIPEIVWAFLFVRILGLGPGPAIFAIGLTFGGIIGKLFAELMESCPPEAGRSLRARGASPIAIALYGVLPQIRHQWVGYGLFRLECAIRSASILGVVGAGGIGSEIDLSIRYFQYDKLGTALMAVLLSVIALEVISQFLRRRPVEWSLGLLSAGILGGFLSLQVRWSQLVSEHALEQLLTFLSGFSNPTLELGWLWSSITSMLQTLCMATCATALAAIIAFGLAPLATTKISVTGYLERVGKRNPQQLVMAKLIHGLSRLYCQVLRAIPELVWALIFVVWVGAGPMAGTIAIAAHTIGILGRLFGEVYDDIDPSLARTMEQHGAGPFATWCYGVLPQAIKPILAFTLFRLEVNIRATAMVGFVGAGGIGNEIHTAISLFHFHDLATLLAILLTTVAGIDAISSSLRHRLLAH
jgi:phosphonate transport system permease protein